MPIQGSLADEGDEQSLPTLSDMQRLCRLLQDSSVQDEENLARRYHAYSAGYNVALRTLRELGFIERKSSIGKVRLARQGTFSVEELRCSLRSCLQSERGAVRHRLVNFLQQFSLGEGTPTYRPNANTRSKYAAIRNFLIELDLVAYDESSDTYTVAPCGYDIFLAAVRNTSPLGLEVLKNRLDEQEALGASAESCVLAYERQRVGGNLADRVKHVALNDTALGYDIESVTVDGDGCTTPRVIEVKAVSLETYSFYWTRCEMDAARSLRGWYYLYLLPVDRSARFRVDRLQVLCDPVHEVLDHSEEWNVEEVAVQCQKVRVY